MQDFTDLSGLTTKAVHLFRSKAYMLTVLYKLFGTPLRRQPFPPNTKGVFYFHDHTHIHPVAGELRFRVLPIDTIRDWNSVNVAELFANGHDLPDYDGWKPWGLSLLSIISDKRVGVYAYMREEGIITNEAVLQVERMKHSDKRRDPSGRSAQVLEQITSSFVADLAKQDEMVVILHDDGITPFRVRTLFMTRSGISVSHPLYSGEWPTFVALTSSNR